MPSNLTTYHLKSNSKTSKGFDNSNTDLNNFRKSYGNGPANNFEPITSIVEDDLMTAEANEEEI